jgi:hypothetical protein
MLRLATDTDIPELVRMMLAVKADSGWANEPGAYNADTLTEWTALQLRESWGLCVVWEADPARLSAFCGVTFDALLHPPHLPFVYEWGWYGPVREAALCWRACTDWGRKHGAVYGKRATSNGRVHARRIEETMTWEKL